MTGEPYPTRTLVSGINRQNAFEGITHYHPQTVVDALAVILSQLTGREFGFISNGATDSERTKTIQGSRDFLSKTPAAKLCYGG